MCCLYRSDVSASLQCTALPKCMRAQLIQSCLILYDPMDYSLPGSSVHAILQARTLEWVAISSSRGSSQSRDWTCISYVSCIAGRFFTAESSGKPFHTAWAVKCPLYVFSVSCLILKDVEIRRDSVFFVLWDRQVFLGRLNMSLLTSEDIRWLQL